MEEVKVFGSWGSPFSWRVEFALKLKGVKYEFIEEDMNNKSPLLLKYNPIHKKIPVLLHNDKPIAESLVIVEYIDETWEGPSILPNDPYERSVARFWAKFIDDKCLSPMLKACLSKGEEREKAEKESIELLHLLDNQVKGQKFFGGESIGLVDIAANFITHWSVIMQELVGIKLVTKEKHPNLSEWIEDYVNYGLVKENLPSKEKLVEAFSGFLQIDDGSKYKPKF